jgi:hypothetical protein
MSALLATAAAACGPVQYIGTVTQSAASSVAAAKAANAETYAPFEYTAALEYLHKAREEEGYADHQAAVHFGKLAQQHADKAKKIAIDNAGRPPEPNPAEEPAPGAEEDAPETENPLEQVKPR